VYFKLTTENNYAISVLKICSLRILNSKPNNECIDFTMMCCCDISYEMKEILIPKIDYRYSELYVFEHPVKMLGLRLIYIIFFGVMVFNSSKLLIEFTFIINSLQGLLKN